MSTSRAALALLAALSVAACDARSDGTSFQGYVVADPVLVGPEEAGRLVALAVEEGGRVAEGGALFALDGALEEAERNEAGARLAEARATLADLRARQQRPEEMEVLRARKRRAEADLALAASELERRRELFERGVISRARLDEAQATYQRDQAIAAETGEEIEAARLPARADRIAAAEAAVAAAEAALARAEVRLERRRVAAPAAGVVRDVYYRPGEFVAAGQPVVALLPPERLRVRFFVPEPILSSVALGQAMAVTCDGCPPGLRARVSYISPEAEFTPPVIFGPEERAKLVFLVEAVPEGEAMALAPGQPVTVLPPGAEAGA
ncbi:MAG TPA: HlyD family efflux transporter periplasmic adaptor subunit [Geminicoccaceae bacterium]|nr:HlyD family efflux transporter periplasmic adaptor subunit [Geminicoccaceae bacterium]